MEVGFFVDIQRNPIAGSRLQFHGGYIVVSSFEFEGEREQAREVVFSKEYKQGLRIPFTSDEAVEALDFQIPQGNYTGISIAFETFEGFGESSMLVQGAYRNSEGREYPLVFVLESSEEFEIQAKSYSDGSQIILKKEAPVSAYIKLNPVYWFQAVPLSALDEAEVVLWNGVPTIVISEEVNEEIYELVEDRLDEASEVVFIY